MSEYDEATKNLSPEMRERLMKATSRVGLSESDPFWVLLAAQCELFDGFRATNTNGNQLPTLPGAVQSVDHVVHFNEMAAAFERLTGLVQEQKAALVKISQDQDKTYRKVNLFVEGQAQYKLAKWFWWTAGGCFALLLAVAFFSGMRLKSIQDDERFDRLIKAQTAAAQATDSLLYHGGSIAIAPITGVGKGIVITRGNLKQGESTDGAILLTQP